MRRHVTFRDRVVQDWLVVSVLGELDLAGAPELAVLVRARLNEGARPTCIDLAGATFIDSAGMSTLLTCMRHASRRDVDLVVVAPSGGAVRRALEIVRLPLLVPVVDDVARALAGQAPSVELSITKR